MNTPPPRTIVIIHGAGDKVEAIVRDLARAVAGRLRIGGGWARPVSVRKLADLCCDARDGVDADAFTAAAYEVAALDRDPARPPGRLPIFEFGWAGLSRPGPGFLGESRVSWQCLVGLPRIGYQSLARGPGGVLLMLARAAFVVAWALIVLRLIVALGLIAALARAAAANELGSSSLRYFDALFALDLATYTALLAYALSRGAVALAERRGMSRSPVDAITLAATLLLTQSIPLAIAEATTLDARLAMMEPWYTLADVPEGQLPQSYGPTWFYTENSLPGFITYLAFGLVALWAIAVGLAYGLGVRRARPPAADGEAGRHVARRMAALVRLSGRFWLLIAALMLVGAPLVWWAEFLHMRIRGSTIYYLYGIFDSSASYGLIQVWLNDVAAIVTVIIWVILTVSPVRKAMAPLLELLFDVSSYFPPIPVVDRYAGTRFLMGGPRKLRALGTLRRTLVVRLCELLQFAREARDGPAFEQPGGPVLVIAHSLGSMIALAALEAEMASDEGGPWVDLITLGNPAAWLDGMFPHLFGRAPGSDGAHLPCVRRWLNLYRAGDLVGRDVVGFRGGDRPAPFPQNEMVGNGGHIGYFGDDEVIARAIAWAFPAGHREAVADDPA